MTFHMPRRIASLALVVFVGAAGAQTPTTTTRTTVAIDNENIRQAVTTAVIRDGRLGLVGTNPRLLSFLTPAGATDVYTSESGIKIVVRDGRVAELAAPKGSLGSSKFDGALTQELKIAPISTDLGGQKAGSTEIVKIPVRSIAIARDGSVRLQATDGSGYTIPNGDYIGADGRKSITIRDGRAVQFLLPGTAQGVRDVEGVPSPVVAPIRR